jgi:uncharacterized protein
VRVAPDTNVLVSALATRGLCADIFNLVLAEHELMVGETVVAELRRVLREKIRVPVKTIGKVEALLRHEVEVVGATTLLKITIRDSTDVPVLSEAAAGNAEVRSLGIEIFYQSLQSCQQAANRDRYAARVLGTRARHGSALTEPSNA